MNSFVVVGLGFGDEGKGATVDFLCSEFEIDFVVKYSGGHQAGHRVVVGERDHVFAQFGAGALAGVPTVLDRDFIIEPMAMEVEREALERLGGNTKMYIHPDCPVTTRYHRAFNRLTELKNQHGSCGVGVGATRMTDNIGIGIRASDVGRYGFESQVRRLRSYLLSELCRATEGVVAHPDAAPLMAEFDVHPAVVCKEVSGVEHIPFASIPEDASVVFEGSQGILLDELYGYHPYTTWSTVTPRNALEFPGFDRSRSLIVGVMRTYMTRHGNGPMGDLGVLHSGLRTNSDPNNQYNQWQGHMRELRWGQDELDYALNVSGADVIALNHIDRMSLGVDCRVPVFIRGAGEDRSARTLLEINREVPCRTRIPTFAG